MTKTSLSVILVLVFATFPAWAEDWTVNGNTYHNVTVTKVDSDKVHITYDGGIGSVNLADLPADLQKRFNYDPAKAKAAEQAEAERQAESDQERALEAKKQAANDAKLEREDAINKRDALLRETAKQFPVVIKQVLPDGLLCETQSIVDVSSYNVASYEGTGKLIFVQTPPEGMAEGNMISVLAYQNGTYSYTDTQNATRTVEKWVGSVKPTK